MFDKPSVAASNLPTVEVLSKLMTDYSRKNWSSDLRMQAYVMDNAGIAWEINSGNIFMVSEHQKTVAAKVLDYLEILGPKYGFFEELRVAFVAAGKDRGEGLHCLMRMAGYPIHTHIKTESGAVIDTVYSRET